jgi:hypothetical protein
VLLKARGPLGPLIILRVFSCRKKWLHGYKTLNNFSLEPLWAHVLSKSIALHFLCRCHLRQGQATKKVILDYTSMTLKYLDAVILFLSGWLRKEGIVIERRENS